jgi:hypothetical protein
MKFLVMTETLRDRMMMNSKPEPNGTVESAAPHQHEGLDSGDVARRNALAILAKYAAYTAPAVLAVLSVTTPRAKAGSF